MAGHYTCPTCKDTTEVAEGPDPYCVRCKATMVLSGASLPGDDAQPASHECEKPEGPIAPLNTDAYICGLQEIEDAKRSADQEEREYLRAKDYAGKAKKRLEAAESKLRATVQSVADRLRPKPLFEPADQHTDAELLALLKAEGVDLTPEFLAGLTDEQRADARAWALSMHSEQPRLAPPFLWAGDPAGDEAAGKRAGSDADQAEDHADGQDEPAAPETPGILEGELAVDYTKRRMEELAREQAAMSPSDTAADPSDPPEPPAPDPKADGHHYPARRKRAKKAA